MDLSANMRAIISQRLLKRKSGKGRAAAIEILINSPLIKDLILQGELHDIKPIMQKSRELGMQTFDQALFTLYRDGIITYESALAHADSANDLRLMIKLNADTNEQLDSDDVPSFTLQEEDDNMNMKGNIDVKGM